MAKAPRDFVAQLVHHHMEAYLEAAGLSPALNTDTFFGLH